jgi:hypothetical protein
MNPEKDRSMNRIILVFAAIVGLFTLSYAGVPVQNMSPAGFALDYSGLWRGATITEQKVGAHENEHLFTIHYAPIPYLLLSAGLGVASYSVDTNQADATHKIYYNGNFGFSPSFGITAFTPYLYRELVRITAGATGNYLNTADMTKRYSYAGLFTAGSAGVIFSVASVVDIEFGGRGLFIMGEMQGENGPMHSFSNNEKARGYLSVTIQTPLEGGYITLDFDASPNISDDWSKGPVESSIGITAGAVIHNRTSVEKSKTTDDKNFPRYKDLEKKVVDLQKELK